MILEWELLSSKHRQTSSSPIKNELPDGSCPVGDLPCSFPVRNELPDDSCPIGVES